MNIPKIVFAIACCFTFGKGYLSPAPTAGAGAMPRLVPLPGHYSRLLAHKMRASDFSSPKERSICQTPPASAGAMPLLVSDVEIFYPEAAYSSGLTRGERDIFNENVLAVMNVVSKYCSHPLIYKKWVTEKMTHHWKATIGDRIHKPPTSSMKEVFYQAGGVLRELNQKGLNLPEVCTVLAALLDLFFIGTVPSTEVIRPFFVQEVLAFRDFFRRPVTYAYDAQLCRDVTVTPAVATWREVPSFIIEGETRRERIMRCAETIINDQVAIGTLKLNQKLAHRLALIIAFELLDGKLAVEKAKETAGRRGGLQRQDTLSR